MTPKLKTTNAAIRNRYPANRILCVGYCDLQGLLQAQRPFAYTRGVYGWNADFYDLDGLCISTGYRPIGKSNQQTYELVRKYEEKHYRLMDKYRTKWSDLSEAYPYDPDTNERPKGYWRKWKAINKQSERAHNKLLHEFVAKAKELLDEMK